MRTGDPMIINWYSTNIDLGSLPTRLRKASALWISVSDPGKLPSLKEIEGSYFYEDLSPYSLMTENQGEPEVPRLVFMTAGTKVVELYGSNIAGKSLDDILTKSGQTLAREIFGALRKERKPIYMSVSGSPVINRDIEGIVMPLMHEDATKELVALVYNY